MKPSTWAFIAAGAAGVAGLVYKLRDHLHAKKHREDTHTIFKQTHVKGIESAVGIMAQAVRDGRYVPPEWVQIPYGDLTVTVGADMLKVDRQDGQKLRMMVSWPETQEICKTIGCVAPTQKLVDAIYAAAPVKTVFHSLVVKSDPESGGAKMHSMEHALKANADVDEQLAAKGWDGSTLQSGAEKYWLLSPRLTENSPHSGKPAAINYGARDKNGKALQPPSAAHDINYLGDSSQQIRPIARFATDKAGNKVDLLDVFAQEGIPAQYLDLFRTTEVS